MATTIAALQRDGDASAAAHGSAAEIVEDRAVLSLATKALLDRYRIHNDRIAKTSKEMIVDIRVNWYVFASANVIVHAQKVSTSTIG